MKRLFKTILLLSFTLASIGLAENAIKIRFIESAPKDKFLIQNNSTCNLNTFTLTVDLSDSMGKLIFDTTEAGAGVEVFQPFEIIEGDIQLVSSDAVNDGDKTLTIRIDELNANASAGFSIDLDDTLVNSALGMIRVTDAEIENAIIRIVTPNEEVLSTTFDTTSTASLSVKDCF